MCKLIVSNLKIASCALFLIVPMLLATPARAYERDAALSGIALSQTCLSFDGDNGTQHPVDMSTTMQEAAPMAVGVIVGVRFAFGGKTHPGAGRESAPHVAFWQPGKTAVALAVRDGGSCN